MFESDMSKKKGLSLDSKRDAILDIYRTRLEPLNLKEIENYGSKAGVVQQTIKVNTRTQIYLLVPCADLFIYCFLFFYCLLLLLLLFNFSVLI